ncbi:hypothetical protein MMC10_008153 [Thelotrema lepadinum]|nr:hypothetical protein [Thelotrema lepadinum]
MRALEECHDKGFIWKLFGNCNDVKREVNKCLAQARSEWTAQNREKARPTREKVVKRWREIEENS